MTVKIPVSLDTLLTQLKFENGTITYSLTSTLTKPTTISPTLVEHYKLKVKENIDIARTAKPRPQTVSLETVKSRRPVMHMKRKFSGSNRSKETAGSQLEIRSPHAMEPSSASEAPRSPGLSEIESVASMESSSTSNTRSGTNVPPGTDTRSMSSGLFSLSSVEKTITAQTEVLQGGCLPGDVLNIRVSVDHTKPIKSMQGVLITFYRLARIDTHPAIPLGPSNDITNARYEDYYPRSRTGLGGLSLSSAGSSRAFRQDLSQNIAPLIVDPTSLTAILRTTVHVPEHIFPSISGVPGSMISFKYFVEVIIDLRGKLGQDRLATKLSLTNTPQHSYEDPKINIVDRDNGVTFSSTPGFNFLVTDQIRRQKGIVFTKTEILVGTMDSARSGAKQKARESTTNNDKPMFISQAGNGHLPGYYSSDDYLYKEPHPGHHSNNTRETRERQALVVPPMPLDEPLDEKARIRRAEMTLLPSAPPDEGTSSAVGGLGPSAPLALNEDDFQDRYNLRAPAPRYEAVPTSSTSARAPRQGIAFPADSVQSNGTPTRSLNSENGISLDREERNDGCSASSTGYHNEPASTNGTTASAPASEPRHEDGAVLPDKHDKEALITPIPSEVLSSQGRSDPAIRDFEHISTVSDIRQDQCIAIEDATEHVPTEQNPEIGNKTNGEHNLARPLPTVAEVDNHTDQRAGDSPPAYKKGGS